MKSAWKTTLSAAVLGTMLAVSAAGAAFATASSDPSTPTPTVAPKVPKTAAECQQAITDRLAEITKLEGRIGDAATKGHLTKTDAAALNGLLGAAQTGLSALQGKISPSDPTLAADCRSIATDFRIYALRAPQVHLTISFDNEQWRVTKLGDAVTKLTALTGTITGGVPDLDGAKAALADAGTQLANASSALQGFSLSGLLALAPQQWHAGVLTGDVSTLKGAHSDLKAAAADVHKALADLGK